MQRENEKQPEECERKDSGGEFGVAERIWGIVGCRGGRKHE